MRGRRVWVEELYKGATCVKVKGRRTEQSKDLRESHWF